jgi:hypothetical protein
MIIAINLSAAFHAIAAAIPGIDAPDAESGHDVYAFWLGSGISLERMPPLKAVAKQVLTLSASARVGDIAAPGSP